MNQNGHYVQKMLSQKHVLGPCPPGVNQYSCYFQKGLNRSYQFHCNIANWYAAMEACQSQCKDRISKLAIFENQSLLDEVMDYMLLTEQKKKCDVYWVGFTRTLWNLTGFG